MMYKDNFVAVVKCRGKILRERSGGSVYLPFGSEYSILLKNKDARRALVNIEVDGKDVLNGHGLIMEGNETQEIKGFMRDMSKTNRFKFIQKTREIQSHRGDRIDDGLVRVTYKFEKAKSDPVWIYRDYGRTEWNKLHDDSNWGFHEGNGYYYNDSPSTAGNSTVRYSCNTKSLSSSAPNVDEGITVKGEKINQNYYHGSIGSLESKVRTIVLHLKGATKKRKKIQKAVTVKTKLRCETCGRKNRSTNKYCYNCGTYLD
jgi:hypothetical protein